MGIIVEVKSFKEKIQDDLDNIDTGVFIGFSKDTPRKLIFIPHTHDAPSKLGLIRFAQMLAEADANNQIGFSRDADRVLAQLLEKKAKEMGLVSE